MYLGCPPWRPDCSHSRRCRGRPRPTQPRPEPAKPHPFMTGDAPPRPVSRHHLLGPAPPSTSEAPPLPQIAIPTWIRGKGSPASLAVDLPETSLRPRLSGGPVDPSQPYLARPQLSRASWRPRAHVEMELAVHVACGTRACQVGPGAMAGGPL